MGPHQGQGRIKDALKQMKMRTQQSKSVGHWESNPKREIYSITGLSPKKKKERKSSDKQSKVTLKKT